MGDGVASAPSVLFPHNEARDLNLRLFPERAPDVEANGIEIL